MGKTLEELAELAEILGDETVPTALQSLQDLPDADPLTDWMFEWVDDPSSLPKTTTRH